MFRPYSTMIALSMAPPAPTVSEEASGLHALLSQFDPATPELLAQRALTSRSDWKFVLPFESVQPLLAEMQESHALLLAGDARVARYRSRYYDTESMQCYQDHRRGKPRRFKMRHRHYLDRSLSMFEIKARGPRGDTRKERLEVPFIERGGELDDTCRAFAETHLKLPLDGYAPSLDNSFSRVTFLAYEAEERITVDIDLAFSQDGSLVRLPGLSIVEVKSASPRHLTPTLLLLAKVGLRPQGMSKYCAGATLLEPDLLPSWFADLRRRINTLSQPAFALGVA